LHEGTGSVLNLDGDVEMDALVMEGRDLNAGARSNKIPRQFRLYLLFASGAVAGLRDIKHAVSVARLVMEKSEHVLIAGAGANRFAAEHGVPRLEPGALITEFEKQCLEDVKNSIKG
jgi:L-asparaginase / beta-aspartyl-peptidase